MKKLKLEIEKSYIMKKFMISLVAVIFATSGISISTYAQETGSYKDTRDGKVYKTVKIGTQIWMAENLAYKASSGCWAYDNNEANVADYGRLYTWEVAKKSCPTGWHLPNDEEWKVLVDLLGQSNDAGSKLKETGIEHWNKFYDIKTNEFGANPNTTNESGFTARPGGCCNEVKSFKMGSHAFFWSATEIDIEKASYRALVYDWTAIPRHEGVKKTGFSVRCIKDEK